MLHAVIMAGGSGTRFWPRSRERSPKQLLAIGTERALVVETCARIAGVVATRATHVITNAAYRDQVRALLPELPADNVVGEPTGRDTAAAIGLAAIRLLEQDAGATMLVMPADHIITPVSEFHHAVRASDAILRERPQTLITFGIRPTEPATGFGYIHRGVPLPPAQGIAAFAVDSFKEKPLREVAEEYLRSGGYYWNAGIFAWRASTILDLIRELLPELHRGLMAIRARGMGAQLDAALREIYPALPKISIDFGVLEKAPDRTVLEAPFTWDDVGSWRALERHCPADAAGNVVLGDAVVLDGSGNIIDARGGLVALLGLSDVVVVHTPDVTLVCPKARAEEVKQIIEQLKARGGSQFL